MNMCLCAYANMCEDGCLWSLEEDVKSPAAGVTGGCEPPSMGPLEERGALLTSGLSLQCLTLFVSLLPISLAACTLFPEIVKYLLASGPLHKLCPAFC